MVKKSLCDLGEGRKEVIGWRRRKTSGFGAVGLVERQNFTLGGQTTLSYIQVVERWALPFSCSSEVVCTTS
jgi:hypothetical protein